MSRKPKTAPQLRMRPNQLPGSRTVQPPAGDRPDPDSGSTQQTPDETPPAGDLSQ